MMTIAEAVGKRLKELLFEKGITQYRLVKVTCLNEKTIRDLIRGKTKDVNLLTVYLIADALGMKISEFTNCEYFDEFDL